MKNLPKMTAEELSEKDRKYVWHPFTPFTEISKILPLESAEGCYLYTSDGRKILDAVSSWWVNLHGHSRPEIAEAAAAQARKMEHVIFAGFTHEPAVRLAERLIEILPENQEKIFYSDNGSTACEVALKMALQFWFNRDEPERRRIITFNGSYHGDTFGAMSVGDRSPFSAPFSPLLFASDYLDPPLKIEDESGFLANFEQLAARKECAAFIYEPLIQGASGMRMYRPEVLDQALEIAQKYGIICIADEVMTGFGRTGKWFASDYCPHKPDIICLSKGLTAGAMALGVTACSSRIFDEFRAEELHKTFFHGHSFTANPIACAVALAGLDLLLSDTCRADIDRLCAQQKAFAEKMQNRPGVLGARSFGTIAAIEVETDKETSYFNEARSSLYDYFLSRDVLLRPLGNVIYVLPPYIITNKELERVYEEIQHFVDNKLTVK